VRLGGRVVTAAISGFLVLVAGCASEPPPSLVLGCPLDQVTGVLEPLGPPGSIGIFTDGDHLILTWGDGTRTVDVGGTLSVVSPAGTVTARVGDRVTLTGGRIRAGEFVACGPRPAS